MVLNSSVDYDPFGYEKINFNQDTQRIVVINEENISFFPINENFKNNNFNFCSNTKKVVIKIFPTFFHFYVESFATLLWIYLVHKDIEVIAIDFRSKKFPSSSDFDKSVEMFFLFLNDNNIKYQNINIKDINNVEINNFFFTDDMHDDSRNQAKLLFDMSKKYITKNNKMHKTYIKTNRVKNESMLIEYFKNIGFDIIEQNSFNNFIDQINYYNNSEIVVSATAGGLVNTCFMPDNSIVVELVTSVPSIIEFYDDKESILGSNIHHIYDTLALQKNIAYVAISNKNKTSHDIIVEIENNPYLKKILGKNE